MTNECKKITFMVKGGILMSKTGIKYQMHLVDVFLFNERREMGISRCIGSVCSL